MVRGLEMSNDNQQHYELKTYAPSQNVEPVMEVDNELAKDLNTIPDKMAFKIGEVADMADLKTHVLRYWETEFGALNPKKASNNQRIYQKKDVETVLLIKKLLYRDRFSIEGAKSALKKMKKETKNHKKVAKAINNFESLRDRMHGLIADLQDFKSEFK